MTHTTIARRTHRLVAPLGLVLGAALLGACAGTADITDTDPLVDEVYQAIRLDPLLGASQVLVRHEGGGVVQLNGFLENLADQQSVVEAAQAVDGVTRVENNMTFRN